MITKLNYMVKKFDKSYAQVKELLELKLKEMERKRDEAHRLLNNYEKIAVDVDDPDYIEAKEEFDYCRGYCDSLMGDIALLKGLVEWSEE